MIERLRGLDERLRKPGRHLWCLGIAKPAMHLRQQCGNHFLEQFRIAPEHVERLLEQRQMVAPRHEHRRERGAKIGAIVDADRFHGGQRVEHPRRSDRQSRGAENADKVDDVFDQTTVGREGNRQRGAT